MNTTETSKKFFLACAVAVALGLLAPKAQAQEGLLDLNQKMLRGSAIVESWGAPADKTSCRMASILGICGDGVGMQARSPRKPGSWLVGWRNLRNLNLNLTRFNPKKAAPNRLFQIVKMFIDDVEIAEVGDFKIKLSISLE
ncbi:MAG: hypothetical protein HY748_05745 [Elusimicrobia bacterium]|nr:hypothetical protein [Elusimicrobiota bacterium]